MAITSRVLSSPTTPHEAGTKSCRPPSPPGRKSTASGMGQLYHDSSGISYCGRRPLQTTQQRLPGA